MAETVCVCVFVCSSNELASSLPRSLTEGCLQWLAAFSGAEEAKILRDVLELRGKEYLGQFYASLEGMVGGKGENGVKMNGEQYTVEFNRCPKKQMVEGGWEDGMEEMA